MIEDLAPILPPPRMLDLPCGTAVYLCRALAKDSWLQWHDALPEEEDQWSRLTEDVVAEIKALATGLHQLHKAMPEYKQCDGSPFTVSRWWDPDDDEGWELGRFCLFRFEGKSALEVMSYLPRRLSLQLIPRSERWLEASLFT